MSQKESLNDVWITHLKLAERSARVGLWRIHENGDVEWDEGTYHLYGVDPTTTLTPREIFYRSITEADKARCTAWLKSIFQGGKIPNIEHQLQWPDGSIHWIHASGFLHHENNEKIALGITWDITDTKILHDHLLRTQKEIFALNKGLIEHEKSFRQKIAFELHDYIGQDLLAIRAGICGLMKSSKEKHFEDIDLIEKLNKTDEMISKCFSHIKLILDGLYSPALTERGLVDAIHYFLVQLSKDHKRIDFKWGSNGASGNIYRFPEAVEYAVYMIAREALQNAVKHSNASMIQVMCATEPDFIRLEVKDTGVGFEVKPKTESNGWNIGFLSMRERARQIGAELTVFSNVNEGTQVLLQWQNI